MLTEEPWVRCPPAGNDIPIIVSPGFNTLKYPAKFALEPLCG